MRRGRTASFTGRLSLNIRSPLDAAEDEWALLLRFFEPPALSPSGFAARGSGRQAELDRKLLRPLGRRPRRPAALPLGGMGDRPNMADLGGAGGGVLATQRVAQFAATPCGGLQLVGARCCSPLVANCYRSRASSAIRRIAVLGEGVALAARGGAPRTKLIAKRPCSCDSKGRRACGGASSMPGPDAAARTQQNWAELLVVV